MPTPIKDQVVGSGTTATELMLMLSTCATLPMVVDPATGGFVNAVSPPKNAIES